MSDPKLRHDLMQRCSKFDSCSAPVCPLDPMWRQMGHLSEERACLYLRESAKPGGMERIGTSLPRELADRVAEAYREIVGTETMPGRRGLGSLRSRITAASKTGSKLRKVAA